MKKAIVVTPTDGTREVIEDKVNGLIVDFKQPEKLAEAYLTYKNNKDLKQTCENNALKLVKEKFNSQRVSNAVLQIYKEVLA
jgi:glycosyltransferase involved in cell wall biosynthesis